MWFEFQLVMQPCLSSLLTNLGYALAEAQIRGEMSRKILFWWIFCDHSVGKG